MGKRRQKRSKSPATPSQSQGKVPGIDAATLATLACLVGALLVATTSRQKIGFIEQRLDDRLGRIEAQVSRVVENAAGATGQSAEPSRRGPDPNRVYDIQTAGAPVKGAPSAPITIVEFSDFQCPFCSRVGPTLRQIQDVYGDRVKIVWKHLPLDMHPLAPEAHIASVAAHRQGKFWEFHDRVFANQQELNTTAYTRYVQELGLDTERFERDLVNVETMAAIDADKAEAQSMQITGTPAFFINGRFLRGAKPFGDFARLINAELERLGLQVPDGAQHAG